MKYDDSYWALPRRGCGRCGRMTRRCEIRRPWRGGILVKTLRRHIADGSEADEFCAARSGRQHPARARRGLEGCSG